MAWPLISLRERRRQVRDDVAAHLPGADASVPNSVLRVMSDAQSNLTHDNDLHLDWLARMMMPDTAEGEFADRWANIWLPDGRKEASFAFGQATVTGLAGAIVPTGAELTAPSIDALGNPVTIVLEVRQGVTLATTSAVVDVVALTAGSGGNIDEGRPLAFTTPPDGIDGAAIVAAPGLAGGAEEEDDVSLIERYIDRIQQPPQGGAAHDYVKWAREVGIVTRAWAAQEMGIGTITVRVMCETIRADGIPTDEDLDVVAAYIDERRPVTVADLFVVAPIKDERIVTITTLANDTPEVRTNIALEIAEMLKRRARPGGIVYASWVREAVSAATGEDHHDVVVGNLVPATAGHMIFITVVFV